MAEITKEREVELAREYFDRVFDAIGDMTDVVYEFIDPEAKYGEELCRRLNNETAREVLSLGFKQKYGEEWHAQSDVSDENRRKWCEHCTVDCPEHGGTADAVRP